MGPSTRWMGLGACAFGWVVACGGDEFSGTASGGSAGATTGGGGNDGGSLGGSGGVSSGGSSGSVSTGGTASGGVAGSSGGTSSGGTASGGTSSGGTAGTGGLGDAGSDASTNSCNAQSECRLFSSYCDACECIPLKTTDADPPCAGTEVSCTLDPCLGKLPVCDQGQCSVFSGGGTQ